MTARATHRVPQCPLCNAAADIAPHDLRVNTGMRDLIHQLQARRSAPPPLPATPDSLASCTIDEADVVVGDEIGSGRFARVHRGSWHGTPVALKIPHGRFPPTSPEAARFLREIRLLATLRHPNIASLYGVVRRGDGTLILVIKLGRHSLWDAMRGDHGSPTPLLLPRVLSIAAGVARALVYLHKRLPAVVHCDIKSANVLLDEHGEALLTDFGVSRELATMGGATAAGGGARGTSGWCAPENFDAEHGAHGRPPSDVYSLGVLVNEMAAGVCPFVGRTDMQIMRAVDRGQRPALVGGAEYGGLAELVAAMWAQEAGDRPSTADALERLLALQGEVAARAEGVGAMDMVVPGASSRVADLPAHPFGAPALPAVVSPAPTAPPATLYPTASAPPPAIDRRSSPIVARVSAGSVVGASVAGAGDALGDPSVSRAVVVGMSLFDAVLRGRVDVVSLLLERGVDMEAKDSNGCTPLLIAVSRGCRDVASLLLERGANKEAKNKGGCTPLHLAASSNHKDVVSLLLERGANKEAKNKDGWTPLYAAASRGCTDVVSLLLERGVNKEAMNENGWTSLHAAASSGYKGVVSLLLDRGAALETSDQNGSTPLHAAASNGHKNVVSLLLERGAEKDARDMYGRTPLHTAASCGHANVVLLLQECGANMEVRDKGGWTPLHTAASKGHMDVVLLLLYRGAEIEPKSKNYTTPLYDAAINGHKNVVLLLLERGADKEAKDKEGRTPMHAAAYNGHTDVVTLLLERGANVEWKDTAGWTPLHNSASYGHKDTVSLLLDRGAALEASAKNGWTPLHAAASKGHGDVVLLLLERGANKKVTNLNGQTPLQIAVARGHNDVVAVLLL